MEFGLLWNHREGPARGRVSGALGPVRAGSIPIAAFGSVLGLLQLACPAMATPPPGPESQETPIEQPGETAPPPQAPPAPSVGAAPAPGNEAAPAASNGPDFIEQPIEQPAGAPAPPAPSGGPFSFLNNMDRSAALFGDLWGARPLLARYGMTLTIADTEEVLGNVTGGTGLAWVPEGLTTATLQMDTQRAFGWYGGLLNASGLEIHGGNLSEHTLQTLQTASGIEADPTVRLWELWYQQKFLEDKVDVKIGQQSLDQEFMVTQNGSYFINTMFGWPMLPSADLPGGGPAYPLSALGVRARAHATDAVTLLAGVYNGSPVASIFGDPQKDNAHGVNFLVGQGVLGIVELQYAYPSPNTIVQAGEEEPLARVYKIGFWYDSWQFASQQWANDGLLLANPASSGIPQILYGNYAFYAVADQMIWRAADPDRNINVFVRPMFTPIQDRNLINFSLNAGVTMHEPIFGRDDDTFGLAIGYTHVSLDQQAFDRETAYYNLGTYVPVRSGETFIEATYQYQASAWLQIQPDFQYAIYPGAGLANPNNPNKRIGNEAVVGLRINAQL
jgi:porin